MCSIDKNLVTIFILNWNQIEKVRHSIESALNQTYQNIEILVVDNGSTDESVAAIKTNYPQIKLIVLDKNYGCPGGRNRGIEYCKGDYIFYVDNDGILHKDAVKNAMETILLYPNVGVIAGKVIDINKIETFSNDQIKNEVHEVGLFKGGISLHKKKIYDIVGKYPDEYIYGGEENFLSMKLIDNNIKILRNEAVILFHPLNTILKKPEQHKRSFQNVFVTAFQLYPLPLLLFFIIYFSFVYMFFASKYGFLSDYFKIYSTAISRAFNSKRQPIKISTFIKYRRLNNNKNYESF